MDGGYDLRSGRMLMFGGITVRATDLLDPDFYAVVDTLGDPPERIARWRDGPVVVAPGRYLVVSVQAYEALINDRGTTRILPASGFVVVHPWLNYGFGTQAETLTA